VASENQGTHKKVKSIWLSLLRWAEAVGHQQSDFAFPRDLCRMAPDKQRRPYSRQSFVWITEESLVEMR
jgi:hypothetical protein